MSRVDHFWLHTAVERMLPVRIVPAISDFLSEEVADVHVDSEI